MSPKLTTFEDANSALFSEVPLSPATLQCWRDKLGERRIASVVVANGCDLFRSTL